MKNHRFMPLYLALAVVVGLLTGTFYGSHFAGGQRLSIINAGSNKLQNLLHIVDDQYVDTVSVEDLVEKAMPVLLSELDPHSTYISAKDAQQAEDDLSGSFSGVGIEFVIRDDTLRVQNVIQGGPSERAGVLAGDMIVSVDGNDFTGQELTNDKAIHTLKGPEGTKVKLGVKRWGEKDLREISVTRGEIPTHSIAAVYMMDDETGYIKIKKFSESTYMELLVALAQLSQQGFQGLVLDLRGNTGGYLRAAVQVANEFLPKERLIVYTEGRKSPREDYYSDGRGSYRSMPLVVLIDETSASAAEILAGCIQDNDRGTIVGRRSFGKGLVQTPVAFNDGSMVRLTIARYYTPSGRCIQKPYTPGGEDDYAGDLVQRLQRGEFYSADSIKHEGPEYHTVGGRVVYGGGGITPDIFVPEDTSDYTSYYKEAAMRGLILNYAYQYTDAHRKELADLEDMPALERHLKRQDLVEKFAQWAEKNGLKRRNLMIQKSHRLLEEYITCRIIYNIQNEAALTQYLNQRDPVIKETLKVMKEERGE